MFQSGRRIEPNREPSRKPNWTEPNRDPYLILKMAWTQTEPDPEIETLRTDKNWFIDDSQFEVK